MRFTHVHSLNVGDKIVIAGPFGRGFSLKPDAEGHVLIIAGGTGILPFLDLLDYLLKKALSMSLQKSGKDSSWIQPTQNFSDHFAKTKFTLFCSFRSLDDFVGHQTI